MTTSVRRVDMVLHVAQVTRKTRCGRRSDAVRVYANVNRATTLRTPSGFAEVAGRAAAEGFDAIKIAPFDDVAGCEEMSLVPGFLPFLEAGAYDVMMPDVKYVGGMRQFIAAADAMRARRRVHSAPSERSRTSQACRRAPRQGSRGSNCSIGKRRISTH